MREESSEIEGRGGGEVEGGEEGRGDKGKGSE